MFSFFFLALIIKLVNSTTCSGSPVQIGTCSSITSSTQCASVYEFSYDINTAYPSRTYGVRCVWAGTYCALSPYHCTPKCNPPKTGGPNNRVCADFACIQQCRYLYADNGGNKWCYYDTTTNTCKEAFTCG